MCNLCKQELGEWGKSVGEWGIDGGKKSASAISIPIQNKTRSGLLITAKDTFNMPVVTYKDKEIKCEKGANLRKVLLENGFNPHNGNSRLLNCIGMGTCGTCAVKITGKTAPLNGKEKRRLSLAPHQPGNGLRLSCQVCVDEDIWVEKGAGFWGQEI